VIETEVIGGTPMTATGTVAVPDGIVA